MKKTLALLLCAMLVLALVPVVALPVAAGEATVVYVKTGAEGDGTSADNAVGMISQAYDKLDLTKDCTVVVCGPLDVKGTFIRNETYTGKVTITSNYGGVDYAATAGAQINAPAARFVCFGETVFENVKINMTGDFWLVVTQEYHFVLGNGVTVIANSEKTNGKGMAAALSILAGFQNAQSLAKAKSAGDAKVEVYSGEKILIGAGNRAIADTDRSGKVDIIVGGNAQVGAIYLCSVNKQNLKDGDINVTVQDNANVELIGSALDKGSVINSLTLNWLGGTIGNVRLINGYNIASFPASNTENYTDESVLSTYTGGTKLVYNDTTAAAANFAEVSGLFTASEKTAGTGSVSEEPAPAAPTKVEVPARPTLTSEKVIYQGFNNGNDANDGLSKSTAKKTFGLTAAENGVGIVSLLDDGGKIIIISKCYIGQDGYTIPAFNGNTILFTAKDNDGKSCIGKDPNDATGDGQWGYIMVIKAGHVIIPGNVILRDIGLLDRTPSSDANTSGWHVAEGGKLVVEDTVVFAGLSNGYAAPDLIVDEGGYAYLDTLGFLKYTGKGTIVVNNKLVDKVTKDDFAGFEGTICDEDGNVLFASAPANPTPGTTPVTGSMTVVIAAGAILASFGAVVALKKREER